MKKLLLILACSVAFLEVAAQDMIIYKDKTIDEVTIIEVNPDFIKYREYGAPVNSATFSIEKDYLSKIIFESGRVMDLSKTMMDDERIYANQRRHGIKLDIGAISQNYMFIVYEEAINPSSSWEAGALFVGAGYENQNGWNDPEHAMGAGLYTGFKFKRSPNFYMQRMRYGHIMRGSYIKPNLMITTFNYDRIDYDHPPDPVTFMYPTTRESAFAGAAMLEFGNQLVLSERLMVEYSAGFGYGFTTKQVYWNYSNYGFSGGVGTDLAPYVWNFGLKVGYLLK